MRIYMEKKNETFHVYRTRDLVYVGKVCLKNPISLRTILSKNKWKIIIKNANAIQKMMGKPPSLCPCRCKARTSWEWGGAK